MRLRHVLPLVLFASPLTAQQASFIYRLGKDTVAIDQFTRTATRVFGDMVQRAGPAVVRVQYEMSVGADGRPTAATIRRMQGDGTPIANSPTEFRFRFTADSVTRDAVWPDSVQTRTFAASHAFVAFPVYVYGPTELLAMSRKAGKPVDSIPALGLTGGPGFIGLEPAGGDTLRLRGAPYAMGLRYDAAGLLQSIDGKNTTNKILATRDRGGLDVPAMARGMKPTGVLSVREVARGAFGPGGIVLIDYGRPLVRERTVWGGTLVPFDSIWRAGANDATHLVTTRVLTFGGTAIQPGLYTLWIQHTHAGTFLIVNRQIGQWGTMYDAAGDVARIPLQVTATPSHVEEFTITIRSLGNNRGAFDFAWGPSIASAQFTVSIPRP